MLENYFLEITAFFIGAVLISWLINRLLLKFSRNLGIRNKNDVLVRWSNESKPSLGGISMYITFMITTVFYASYHQGDSIFDNTQFIGLMLASAVAFGIGLADDAYNTKPLLKLGGQILCGIIVAGTGSVIQLFHQETLDAIITVVWIVIVMNSLNMLDNMDGITATVSLFILLACMFTSLMMADFHFSFWVIIVVAEIGAIVGFLFYNVNPSRMFMGDTGSQFIGLYVGFFAIQGLWNVPAQMELPSWSGLLLALVAFAPAAADTLTVVINRLKRGVSPMVGGKDHTTHHLVYRGLSDFRVWLVFAMISAASFLLAILLGSWILSGQVHFAWIGLAFFVLVFLALYRTTIKENAKN
ncbi:MAG: MraY family glycosyltransferase [Bacteroidota bacterium]